MIQVKSVSKKFPPNNSALSSITFDAKAGEVIYLLGESGSGKSTLVKILAGLEDATKGTVKIDGQKITGPANNLVPGYDDIAYVSQDFKLGQFQTVESNIGLKIPYLRGEEKVDRIEQLLKICGLENKRDSLPKELSGGEQQRISLAAKIAHSPSVVLMDEPFSQLDIPLKRKLRLNVLSMLKKEKTTVIVVSHDPAEALGAADRIMILEEGKLVQLDTPKRLYRYPQSVYAARILGEINQVTTAQKERLVRPEKFILDVNGPFDGTAGKSLFQGDRYNIYLNSPIADSDILIYSDKALKRNETVSFDIIS